MVEEGGEDVFGIWIAGGEEGVVEKGGLSGGFD